MRLLVDIGNSTTVMAIAKADGSIESTWRFKTQKNGTEYFFRNEIIGGLTPRSITPSQIEAVVVSSVVPEVKEELSEAVISVIGKAPHFFSVHDAKRVIDIDVESPTQLGNDRVADAIGAVACYGAPVIVFDLGTATTVGVVNEDKCFIGGMIIPAASFTAMIYASASTTISETVQIASQSSLSASVSACANVLSYTCATSPPAPFNASERCVAKFPEPMITILITL